MTAPPLPGRVIVWGQPWHGDFQPDGTLRLRNGQTLAGAIAPTDQHVHYVSLGAPAVETPADLAAAGGQLLSDAVFVGRGKRYSPLSAIGIGRSTALLRDAAGAIWSVSGTLRTTSQYTQDPVYGQIHGMHAYVDLTAREWGRIGGPATSAAITLGTLDAWPLGRFAAPYETRGPGFSDYRYWDTSVQGITLALSPSLQSALVVIDGLQVGYLDACEMALAAWAISLTGSGGAIGVSAAALPAGPSAWSAPVFEDHAQTIRRVLGYCYALDGSTAAISREDHAEDDGGPGVTDVHTYRRSSLTAGTASVTVEQWSRQVGPDPWVEYSDTMGGSGDPQSEHAVPGAGVGSVPYPICGAQAAGVWWTGSAGYYAAGSGGVSRRLYGLVPGAITERAAAATYDPRTGTYAPGVRM